MWVQAAAVAPWLSLMKLEATSDFPVQLICGAVAAISFAHLQHHLQQRHGWAYRGPEAKVLWHRYQAVLTQEFNLRFGAEDNLDAWHSLCRALRITPLPTTCGLCRLVGL